MFTDWTTIGVSGAWNGRSLSKTDVIFLNEWREKAASYFRAAMLNVKGRFCATRTFRYDARFDNETFFLDEMRSGKGASRNNIRFTREAGRETGEL